MHAGGMAVGVETNGKLMEYAYSEYGKKYSSHPNSNIKFLNYNIPRLADMLDFALENHYRIPNMGIIAWDFTLDEDENIVIIETNVNCPSIWFPQEVTGLPFFGENTEKMIKKLKK